MMICCVLKKKYNLNNRFILTGKKHYDEIPDFIAASDICLLPAYTTEKIMRDIVPIKLYEYAAMKKPVITTKLPAVMKKFGNGNGVIYVDRPEDVIKEALKITTNGSIKDIGNRARLFAERNSWEYITNEFENILQNTIREKRK
jgi:glycosyltransferase involved in cell wall biosynthesis